MFLIAQTIKIDVLHMEQGVKCQVIRPTCQVELNIMSRFFSFPPSSNNPFHEHPFYILKLLFSEALKVCVSVYSAHVCLPINGLASSACLSFCSYCTVICSTATLSKSAARSMSCTCNVDEMLVPNANLNSQSAR